MENETDIVPAIGRQLFPAHVFQVGSLKENAPTCWAIQAPYQIQQGGFSRTGRPDKRHEGSLAHLQTDTIQGGEVFLTDLIHLGHSFKCD